MRKLITILLILLSFKSNATTYYIATTGNDGSGDGSIGNPWKTLYKATSTVTAAGSIIFVNSGTYLETLQSQLSVGVSIEGQDSSNTVIQSTSTADFTEIIKMFSASEGTNGNQHLYNLKFDGRSLATYWAVYITGRSNVEVYHCTFINFKSDGIFFNGRTDNTDNPPSVYSTGNSFHDNIMHNCAAYNLSTGTYGRGALRIGGQQGMLVYNNIITQTERPVGYNGYCIKYDLWGYNKGLKIYNNTLTKIPFTGAYDGDNGWTFCLEMWHCEGGMEIYNNTFQGSIDLVQVRKRAYSFGAKIHDNTFSSPTPTGSFEMGIDFEIGAEAAIVENNIFNNLQQAIIIQAEVWPPIAGWESVNIIENDTIRNNLFSSIGGSNQACINVLGGSSSDTFTLKKLSIYNNTLKTYTQAGGGAPYVGVYINLTDAIGHIQSVAVQNNIFWGFPDSYFFANQTVATWDTLILRNNLRYQNGNSDSAKITGNAPTVKLASNSKIGNPLFVSTSDFNLQSGSPARNSGISLGLGTDIGKYQYGTFTTPTADAGVDKTATLPTTSVSLTGSGTAYGGATITGYLWAKASGPSGTSFSASTSATTNLNFTTAGTYDITLTVTDSNGNIGTDHMTLVVNPMPSLKKPFRFYLFKRR